MIEVRLRGRPPHPTRAWDEAKALGRALVAAHPTVRCCTIVVNTNRHDVLRWRLGREAHLSVHWALAGAAEDVLGVIDRAPGAWDRLEARLPRRPLPPLKPRGEVHDLEALLATQRVHLPEAPEVPVTWGRWPARPPRRVLRLGSCEPDPPLIRIHPVLDHPTVPDWFVGFVVFHELLHVVHPPARGAGRRIVHPRALREAERRHPDHARALEFEKTHVLEWMRRCRTR